MTDGVTRHRWLRGLGRRDSPVIWTADGQRTLNPQHPRELRDGADPLACSRLLWEILIGWLDASSDPGRVGTPPRMRLSGPPAARSRFLHALCTLASSFSVSTLPARQLGILATLRQRRRDSRREGNTERSCRLVPFATRLMDRSLGGVMPRGMDGLAVGGSLLMQDGRSSPWPRTAKGRASSQLWEGYPLHSCLSRVDSQPLLLFGEGGGWSSVRHPDYFMEGACAPCSISPQHGQDCPFGAQRSKHITPPRWEEALDQEYNRFY